MASNAFVVPLPHIFVSSTGMPANGYKLFFYQNGTTTKQAVYTTAAKNVQHANPVILTADGRPPNDAAIHLIDGTAYTVKLYPITEVNDPPTGTPIWAKDDVYGLQALTADLIGGFLYPITTGETSAGIVDADITDNSKRPGSPLRYGAVGDGTTDDTAACRMANDFGLIILEKGYSFVTETLVPDQHGYRIVGEGGALKAKSTLPAGGAIIHSMAGGADAATNQAILDGIYGAAVVSVRTVVTGTVEDFYIGGATFTTNANAIFAIWLVGVGRGGVIERNKIPLFTGGGIVLNGCFGSLSVLNNKIEGNGSLGVALGLGQVGKGTRGGSAVSNAIAVKGNTLNSCLNGLVWDFGAGGEIAGNNVELNAGSGATFQSLDGVQITGNYFEANGASNSFSNMVVGGTGVSGDKCTGLVVQGNLFQNSTGAGAGNNIRVNGATNCVFGPNKFSGTRTEMYRMDVDSDTNVSDCWFWVTDNTSTYITSPTEMLLTNNYLVTDDKFICQGLRIDGELRHAGTTVGFYGTGPVVQGAAIANAKANYVGGELDTEAKIITAVNAANTTMNTILTRLRTPGYIAT